MVAYIAADGKAGSSRPSEGWQIHPELGQLRLLIVEDEAIGALYLERLLVDLGYEVCGVTGSAGQAVNLAGARRPDLVLMDIRLERGGDGVEAARAIKSEFGVPCLFVTAQSDPATLRRAEAADPIGFLYKPYSATQLKAALDAAVKRLRDGPDDQDP